MNRWEELQQAAMNGRLSRRQFMAHAAALGVTTSLATGVLAKAGYADEPKKGGTLNIGIAGGSTTDSLDVTTYTDSMAFNTAFTMMNQLIETDPNNKQIPSLFKSWEASDGAKKWVFKVEQAEFHNGKSLDADDIVYSINLHRGEGSKSGAASGLKPISDVKATAKDEVTITLSEGDADFIYPISDYHVLVVPKDFKDWSHPIGTGPYQFGSWDPGVSANVKKFANHWNKNRGHVDEVNFTCINDTAQRMNAIVAGQVDIIHRVDTATIDLIKAVPTLALVMAHGGYHAIYAARCDMAPFNDPNLRLAVKHAIDREQLLKALFNGYGAIGNDSPIPPSDPYFAKELEQTKYDPDKAKFYLKKAKIDAPVVLSASDAAFNGAVDAALLFQANAKAAGVDFQVKKEPGDGFWDNVWLKAPFCESYWGGRPAATQMFTTAYKSDAAWNETGYKVEKFDKLLAEAKVTVDEAKRAPMIKDLQKMVHEDGGAIIPAFKDWVDATATKVKGYLPHAMFDLCNGRAAEKCWIDEA
jgi:peptide/nickel transport system substrate-binding protein